MKDEIDEVELINRARTDPEKFGLLYERYVDRIYNYVYYRVGNIKDAEDLTSRVFFKALSNIGTYRHMGLPFSAWLYRIAHNQIANYHRDRSKAVEISIENLNITEGFKHLAPEASAQHSQEKDFLMNIIRDLSPLKRELLVLKYVDKLSNDEIAVVFGKTEGAIKSLYHRTLVELRDRLIKKH